MSTTIAESFVIKIDALYRQKEFDKLDSLLNETRRSDKIIESFSGEFNGINKLAVLFNDGSLLISTTDGAVIEQAAVSVTNLLFAMLSYHPFPELANKH